MSITYVRPKSITEALKLLSAPNSIPLAGGTLVNTPDFKQKYIQQPGIASFTLVDLQSLGLDQIKKHGDFLEVDACVTLQNLYDDPHTTESLKQAIKLEAPLNIRNSATVAGTLVACDGRSSFAAAMLAMDAKMNTIPGDEELILGNFLPMRSKLLPGRLITKVTIPLNVSFSFEYVARTKYDRPIVCMHFRNGHPGEQDSHSAAMELLLSLPWTVLLTMTSCPQRGMGTTRLPMNGHRRSIELMLLRYLPGAVSNN